MLSSPSDFAALGAAGRTRSHRLLTVRSRPNALDHDRYAISTGRSVGGAVVRNRVRRRLREILRATPVGVPPRDVLVVCRPASATAGYDDLRTAIRRLLGTATDERTDDR
ncbi:MAG: ribonuclease P protein component [Chloroflexota bacterium]